MASRLSPRCLELPRDTSFGRGLAPSKPPNCVTPINIQDLRCGGVRGGGASPNIPISAPVGGAAADWGGKEVILEGHPEGTRSLQTTCYAGDRVSPVNIETLVN